MNIFLKTAAVFCMTTALISISHAAQFQNCKGTIFNAAKPVFNNIGSKITVDRATVNLCESYKSYVVSTIDWTDFKASCCLPVESMKDGPNSHATGSSLTLTASQNTSVTFNGFTCPKDKRPWKYVSYDSPEGNQFIAACNGEW